MTMMGAVVHARNWRRICFPLVSGTLTFSKMRSGRAKGKFSKTSFQELTWQRE